MSEIRTILFASDLSPESDRAFEHARFLAERFGARLTIYHGLEMPRAEYSGWVDANDDRRGRWERKVREELSRRAGCHTSCSCEGRSFQVKPTSLRVKRG